MPVYMCTVSPPEDEQHTCWKAIEAYLPKLIQWVKNRAANCELKEYAFVVERGREGNHPHLHFYVETTNELRADNIKKRLLEGQLMPRLPLEYREIVKTQKNPKTGKLVFLDFKKCTRTPLGAKGYVLKEGKPVHTNVSEADQREYVEYYERLQKARGRSKGESAVACEAFPNVQLAFNAFVEYMKRAKDPVYAMVRLDSRMDAPLVRSFDEAYFHAWVEGVKSWNYNVYMRLKPLHVCRLAYSVVEGFEVEPEQVTSTLTTQKEWW